jgi:4-amino-4-deoxy-L-arabinose transferase-like glycosyltransferase
MFAVLARAVKVDSLLILFDTLAMLVFVNATFRPRRDSEDSTDGPQLRHPGHYYPQSTLAVIAMFALMGAAVLGKGPVGLVLPTAVIGMFLLLVRLPKAVAHTAGPWPEPRLQWKPRPLALAAGWLVVGVLLLKLSPEMGLVALTLLAFHLFLRPLPIFRPFAPRHFLATCWYMRPITALLAAGVVALPWHVWVGWRDFSWIEGFYWKSNLERATSALEGHGGSALLYYPLAVAIGFLPWSMFLAPVLIGWTKRIRRGDRWGVGYVLLACWLGVYLVVFSIASTKLPNYVVPAFPALALATACYLFHLRRAVNVSAAWWPQVAMGVFAVSGAALIVALPIAAHVFVPGEEWLGAVGLLPLVGAAVCWVLFRRGQTNAAVVSFAGCAALLVVTLLAGVAQRVDRHQPIHGILAEISSHGDQPQIAAFGCLEPTWVFYNGRTIPVISNDKDQRVADYLAGHRDRFLITTQDGYERLKPDLPAGARILVRTPYFLKAKELVVIAGPDSAGNVAALPADSARPH